MTITNDEILLRLTPIFRDVFDDDSILITPETSADDIPEWDSLNHINLIVTVEKAFAVRLKTGVIDAMKNVGDLMAAIRNNLAA